MNADVARFENARPGLLRHAYRMLGDLGEAEDTVQEAFLRWSTLAERGAIENDEAFLRTTITRLALDRLRSARAHREVYIGPWLPEPVADHSSLPEAAATLAEDISFALLLACERLSPLERAAFLLHDAFDVPFEEIAQTLDVTVVAARQLASRARRRVHEARPRQTIPPDRAIRLRDAFLDALRRDDSAALQELMVADVVCTSDSGGKVPAAIVPVVGTSRVIALLLGVMRKFGHLIRRIELVTLNGLAGVVVLGEQSIIQTIALEIRGDAIAAIYVTRNPEKLHRIAEQFGVASSDTPELA